MILVGLVQRIAPILPVLADEIYAEFLRRDVEVRFMFILRVVFANGACMQIMCVLVIL